MVWGTVELEPEVVKWLEALPDDQFGRVEFYIDRLADRGVELGEPYTRHLGAKLRQLRFPPRAVRRFGSNQLLHRHRSSDHSGDGVPQTATAGETAEVERARRAMEECIAEGHTLEGTDE